MARPLRIQYEGALYHVSCRGNERKEIKNEKGMTRHMAMEILYRLGGLKGVEIGKMMGVDYSTVSQGRKRLREKLKTDKNLSEIIERVQEKLWARQYERFDPFPPN